MSYEHSYRVEVWEDGKPVEVVSISPDIEVSAAAWQASLRRRPGALLVHLNGRHIMDRMVAPGEKPREPGAGPARGLEGMEVCLSDLRSWHRLRAWCDGCRHHKWLETAALEKRFGKSTAFSTIEAKLRCTGCGGKGAVRLQIHLAPRD
jgi:hypothetical protein